MTQPAVSKAWRSRAIVIGGIALALVVLIAWLFRTPPVPVDVATVAPGDLLLTVDEEGETRLKDLYVVSAPVAGRVQRIEIEAGDAVVAGETVLARFIPADPAIHDARSRSEAEAGVRLAEADRRKAMAERDFAEADLRRVAALQRQGTVAVATLDRARMAARTARAAMDQAMAALAKRQADLDSARAAIAAGPSQGRFAGARIIAVTSPVSGRVMKRLQQSEQILAAGTPLVEMGDTARLEIVTDVLSADAVKVSEGAEVLIDEWGGPETLAGVVRRVEPFGFTKISALGIEEQRVNIVTDFTSSPERWRALGHGYRVLTRMVLGRRKDVLKVPVGALFHEGTDWAVFVVDRGRARRRAVEIGLKTPLEAEIKAGLSAGAAVIVHPSDRIGDGTAVAPRR
jgi:HlyD family secretion protein